MKLNIIKKKASSLKELGQETIEINEVNTLEEMLLEITKHEFYKQYHSTTTALTSDNIKQQSALGKVTFNHKYNENKGDLKQAVETMYQDYKDGLFKVFLNDNECEDLKEELSFKEENTVVLIKLVMIAGRLW